MKCKNCGFENRKGVKFCEQCGEPLSKEKSVLLCTNCGHKNRKGVKFCEQCGTALGTTVAAGQTPAPQSAAQAQPPVVVIQQEGRKRKFNPVLLLLLLLLLIIPACCLLMLFGQVETPDFVQEIFPDLPWQPPHDDNNGGDQKAEPCDEFADIMKSLHDFEMDCEGINFDQDCRVEFVLDGLEYFKTHADNPPWWKTTQILYQWENGKAGDSEKCWHNTLGGEVKVTCDFPKDKTSGHVDVQLVVEDCTEFLHGEDFAQGADQDQQPLAPQEVCCTKAEPDNVDYFRDPPEVGTLYLGFDLACTTRWDLDSGECAEFDAFVGADTDIYWATGECCPDEGNPYNLVCEAPLEDQKNSKTKIELCYGESCELEFYFQSPYYPPCPAGQTLCAGRCCSIGHCCTCSGQLGCWESCSGCTMH